MPWQAPIAALLLAATPIPLAYPAFPRSADFTNVARWTARQTDIPRGDLLDVRDGFAFAVLPAAARQGPRKLRLEAIEPRAWAALGGRSAELRLDLACAPARATPLSLDVYSASNRLGEVRRGVSVASLPVSALTFRVLAAVLCSPPLQARPLVLAAAEPPSPPSLRPAPPPDRPAPQGRLVAIQIGAFASQKDAVAALQGLNAARPSLVPRLELVALGNAVVYRALLTGFPTRKEAAGFCRDLIRLHRRCLVRGMR